MRSDVVKDGHAAFFGSAGKMEVHRGRVDADLQIRLAILKVFPCPLQQPPHFKDTAEARDAHGSAFGGVIDDAAAGRAHAWSTMALDLKRGIEAFEASDQFGRMEVAADLRGGYEHTAWHRHPWSAGMRGSQVFA